MNWYWWIPIGIAVLVAIRMLMAGSKKKASAGGSSDELAFLDKHRQRLMDVNRELAKVVTVITDLPVIEARGAGGNTVTREGLDDAIENFMKSKILLEWQTRTQMVHVVLNPGKVTVFAKLKPTEPAAAMRVFSRVGENAWTFETRMVDDMGSAVSQADREART